MHLKLSIGRNVVTDAIETRNDMDVNLFDIDVILSFAHNKINLVILIILCPVPSIRSIKDVYNRAEYCVKNARKGSPLLRFFSWSRHDFATFIKLWIDETGR